MSKKDEIQKAIELLTKWQGDEKLRRGFLFLSADGDTELSSLGLMGDIKALKDAFIFFIKQKDCPLFEVMKRIFEELNDELNGDKNDLTKSRFMYN